MCVCFFSHVSEKSSVNDAIRLPFLNIIDDNFSIVLYIRVPRRLNISPVTRRSGKVRRDTCETFAYSQRIFINGNNIKTSTKGKCASVCLLHIDLRVTITHMCILCTWILDAWTWNLCFWPVCTITKQRISRVAEWPPNGKVLAHKSSLCANSVGYTRIQLIAGYIASKSVHWLFNWTRSSHAHAHHAICIHMHTYGRQHNVTQSVRMCAYINLCVHVNHQQHTLCQSTQYLVTCGKRVRCTRAIVSSLDGFVCALYQRCSLCAVFRVHQRNSQRLRFSVALVALLSTFDNVVVYAQTYRQTSRHSWILKKKHSAFDSKKAVCTALTDKSLN